MPLKHGDALVEALNGCLELFARHRMKEVCMTFRQFFSQKSQVFAPQFRILRGERSLLLPENSQPGVDRDEANKTCYPLMRLLPPRGGRSKTSHYALHSL